MKKTVLLAFVSVFLSTAIVWGFTRPTVAHTNESNGSHSKVKFVFASSKTIWVPDNFTTIQEAINAANDGDTIFVRVGTYYEHVTIDKSISLIGENRSATIIDGNGTNTVVSVEANNTGISGFTIQNAGGYGIYLYDSPNCSVLDNNVNNNEDGICVGYYSSNCSVSGNNINNNHMGIDLDDSSSNKIYHNNFINNTNACMHACQ